MTWFWVVLGWLRRLVLRIVADARVVRGWLRKHALTIVTVAFGLLGWALLTSAIADVLGPRTWKVSLGVLCLSLFGWRFLYVIAMSGIYTLLKPKRGGER